MEILSKIFGSASRVKILRLFLFNPQQAYTVDEVTKKSRVTKLEAKRELTHLSNSHFLKEKKLLTKNGKVSQRRQYQLLSDFPYIVNLRDLFNADFFNNRRLIASRFKNCGRIRLLVLSGAFLHQPKSPADLMIVGDDLKKSLIDQVIKNIEAETGRELTYAVFDTNDFLYRLHSSDRFVRDIFEAENELLIDKIGLNK
ncbi:MAG: hypothetical protein COX02_01515 [Candidatus Vogelbacteria bacterium CG22_combo_CG10-13_8_21_14_all_37_9]|uniref:Transcriptional regulator n=1 Tax=Candidatus Vogelbacteria bacterium CG22_combo_CG10-13_8_21_14_all_37_9 TaxID=1975046 RepID=A0A2H0BKJ2_9BACT|nr:MAG: hypothetical protein BK005_00390 [bacterium CG10_37_50]PIP58195.1 MAG: hypothetical protein COX02_01515 [Candidatus Vogelbacteria bacterium CG22_combo_CG10-13_8_21_14_all_37_9]